MYGGRKDAQQSQITDVSAERKRVLRVDHGLDELGQTQTPAGVYEPNAKRMDLRTQLPLEYMQSLATVYNVRDYGATGDGVTDDTTAIQNTLAAAAAGGTVVFPAGTYKFSVALGVQGHNTAMVGLAGSQLVASVKLDRHIDSNDFDYLRFHGLTITGTGVQTVGGYSVILLSGGSTYCVVSQCRIVNAPGSAIVDDGTHNMVLNNVVDTTGEHGIYSSSGMWAVYQGNHIRNVGTVPGTTLGSHGISLAGSLHCTVTGNTLEAIAGTAIVLRDGAQWCTITGNCISGGTDRHFALGTANDCAVVGNISSGPATSMDALRIDGGGRYVIADNMFYRTTAGGAAIRWTTTGCTGQDVVRGNIIHLNSASITQYGIDHDSSTAVDCLIQGNAVYSVNSAVPPASIRVNAGTRPRVFDNITTVGIAELAKSGGSAVHYRSGNRTSTVKAADQASTSTSLADITDLAFNVRNGVRYEFRFQILFTSTVVTTGVKFAVQHGGASIFGYQVRISGQAADGVAAAWSGAGTASDDAVTNTDLVATATVYVAEVVGFIKANADSTLVARLASETGSSITVKEGSTGELIPQWSS